LDTKIAEEFLDELFSSLEALETRSAAVLQFLKKQAGVTDEELAPYMEEASKASNVRWRATRLRMMSLFSSAVKSAEQSPEKKAAQPSENKATQPDEKNDSSRPRRKPTEAEPSQKASSPEESAEPVKDAKQENEQAPAQGRSITSKEEKAPDQPRSATPQEAKGEPEYPGASQPAPQEAGKKDAA
jgi:hypothetical protein